MATAAKAKSKGTVFENNITKTEPMQKRMTIPADLHWKEELESKMKNEGFKYLGEIFCNDSNKYYSARGGKKYRPKHDNKHLDEGHYQGYRFAVHELTEPGDWVFDPTVGSGTAIIESINNGRNAIGIELEWPEMCQLNVDFQKEDATGEGIVISGNAGNLTNLLAPYKDKFGEFSLIVNGTPYPVIGGKTSDAPERKNKNKETGKLEKIEGTSDTYEHSDSFGLLKWNGRYEEFITKMYVDAAKFLKPGGFLVTIIKDPVSKKKAFPLQRFVSEWTKEAAGLKDYGFYLHRHAPETMFMNTYNKRFPDVVIPKYQIGYILQKQ